MANQTAASRRSRATTSSNRATRRSDQAGQFSIVVVDNFIQATRDSGYRGTTSAAAELVDNAIQAGAKTVSVKIWEDLRTDPEYPLHIAVADDGTGMDAKTLRQSLRFGFSSRFDDRTGLGRYGMGLPNSSLSQARRLEVFSWQGTDVLQSFLDIDEIVARSMTQVPPPRRATVPRELSLDAKSGTVIVWRRCDRLDNKRVSTIEHNLKVFLGRVFRHFLWDGLLVLVNDSPVRPIDPLFLHEKSSRKGGVPYGDALVYPFETPDGITEVRVQFAELPVAKWHDLPKPQKRSMGISKGSGVSIVRAGREVDVGWFFMGGKRRENYDDWWRCEVQFDPKLDELFGITHTKQQVRPTEELAAILSPDLEEIARVLNSRARQAHSEVRQRTERRSGERLAERAERRLKTLPRQTQRSPYSKRLRELSGEHVEVAAVSEGGSRVRPKVALVARKRDDRNLFEVGSDEGRLAVELNASHLAYKKLLTPQDDEGEAVANLRALVEAMLIAAARAEVAVGKTKAEQDVLARFRAAWGETLAAFLK